MIGQSEASILKKLVVILYLLSFVFAAGGENN